MALSNDLLWELVQARMAPLYDGQRMEDFKRMVGPKFGELSESALSREFQGAFRRLGIRKLERDDSTNTTQPTLPAKQAQLCGRFPSIRQAIVFSWPPQGGEDSDERLVWEISRQLALGIRQLRGASFFKKKNLSIGVSSGRMTNRLAGELAQGEALPCKEVALLSTTGRFGRRSQEVLDADFNTVAIAAAFPRRSVLETLGHDVVLQGGVPKDTWIARGRQPDIVITGAGLFLSRYHWMKEWVQRENSPALLAPIQKELSEAERICERIGKLTQGLPEPYFPLGDIAGHYLFVTPPEKKLVTDKEERSLRRIAETLNKKLLNISGECLRKSAIWLGAGGLHKVHLLRSIFDEKFPVATFCCDERTAKALLR